MSDQSPKKGTLGETQCTVSKKCEVHRDMQFQHTATLQEYLSLIEEYESILTNREHKKVNSKRKQILENVLIDDNIVRFCST